jgi:hypothetical protein
MPEAGRTSVNGGRRFRQKAPVLDPESSFVSRTRLAPLLALAVVVAGCSTEPASPAPAPSANAPSAASAPSASSSSSAAPAESAHGTAPADPTRAGALRVVVAFQGAQGAPKTVTRSKDEARSRADEALAKLHAGASFEELVRDYSDDAMTKTTGGATGNFERYAMPKAFADATFALGVGETSPVTETPEGFMIIRRVR